MQNFHIRARNATVAHNWFDYEGEMMTNQSAYDPGNTGTQNLLFLGNVVIQNAAPDNELKLLQLCNDAGTSNVSMRLTALWNTFLFWQADLGTETAVVKYGTATLATGTVI